MPDETLQIRELGLAAFDAAFDAHFEISSRNIGAALCGVPWLDAEAVARCAPLPQLKAEPQGWGMRVRMVVLLWEYIMEDLTGYAATHALDEDFNNVCLTRPCWWHHHAPAETVARDSAKGTLQPMKANMKLVVERYVKPWTQGHRDAGLALVLNAGVLATRRGRIAAQLCMAEVFISHCWNEDFGDFARALARALARDVVVWICSFAIWQHGDIGQSLKAPDTCPFARAMSACQRVLVVADRSLEVMERCWCVLEAKLAQEWTKPYDLCVQDELDEQVWQEVGGKLQSLDVKNCKATVEADKTAILEYAAQRSGGVDAVNEAVRKVSSRAIARARVQASAVAGDLAALLAAGKEELLSWRSVRGRSVAHVLARESRIFALRGLLEASAWTEVDVQDYEGQTPLSIAAEKGAVGSVQALLALRANVDARDQRGLTPLHHAAAESRCTIARLLVQAEADLEARGCYRCAPGLSPLAVTLTCRGGHAAVAKVLLGHRADASFEYHGTSMLHTSANYGYPRISAALLAARVELDARNSMGATPVMMAAMAGCVASVSLLLAARASLLPVDCHGRSCRDYCREGQGGTEEVRHILALLDRFDAAAGKGDWSRSRDVCCSAQ